MDRRDEQPGEQPGEAKPHGPRDIQRGLAELDRVAAGFRGSFDRIRDSLRSGSAARALAGRREHMTLVGKAPDARAAWRKVGAGELEFRSGEPMQLRAGSDRGLAYFTARRFDDFRLKARYRVETAQTCAGIAVRFLDPEQPVADRMHSERMYRYDNPAYVAVHTGFEVCLGTGLQREAGTFAGIPIGQRPGSQRHPQTAEIRTQGWNELEIEVRGDEYRVRLNGSKTARLLNVDRWRGKIAATGSHAGFIGILMGEQPLPGAQCPQPGAGAELSIDSIEVWATEKSESAANSESRERATERLAQAARAAKELASKISSKAGDLLKLRRSP